jgi:hypothetical protein
VLSALLILALAAPPDYPAGIELHQSECASGGMDYFFFGDGTVIGKCWGCETQPHVQLGRWERDGADVVARMTREWFGKGRGRVVEHASVDVYEDYVGRSGAVPAPKMGPAELRFGPQDFHPDPDDSCESARPHSRSKDVHSFLRLFDGDHPETFQRLLTAGELQGRPAEELRLMRNEIFARYGFKFRDEALRAHFRGFTGYQGGLSDVDAFLSDVERQNVALLKQAEAAAAAAAPAGG